jgi:hypothetical protein
VHDVSSAAGDTRNSARDVWFALGGILGFQNVAMLRLRNAAFVDEATYIVAGRTMLERISHGDWNAAPFATYFSGAPYLQPIWAAWLDQVGGLALARTLSAVCLALATLALGLGMYRAKGRGVGVGAALAFAVQGTVQFVGHLATPDAPALLLVALALAIAFAASERWAIVAAIAVGGLAAGAGAVKYGAMAYAPPVALVLAIRLWERGARERAVVALLLSGVVGASVLWLLLRLDGGALFDAVWFTTINRPFSEGKDSLVITAKLLEYGGLLLVLAVYGLVQRRYSLALSATLVFGMLVAPVQHIRLGETVSLHKHIAFSALFAAPFAGIAMVRLQEGLRNAVRFRGRDPRSVMWPLAVGSGLALLVFPGLAQAGALYDGWPQETPTIYRSVAQGLPKDARILSEEADLGGYYGSALAPSQWVGPQAPYRTADGRDVAPDQAVAAALRDGAYDRIVLRFDHSHTWSATITPLLQQDPRYVVRETVRYRLPGEDGAFVVWERRAP